MSLIDQTTFVCIDCEATGLDTKNDSIVEIALVKFKNWSINESFETLINPKRPIPPEATKIHLITDAMVEEKPTFNDIANKILPFIGGNIIVGHYVGFDLELIQNTAEKLSLPWVPPSLVIDTLRLAKFYGKCSINSLQALCSHFEISSEGHHRAMCDVFNTIKIFQKLSTSFTNVNEIEELLKYPIEIARMPLGRYRGTELRELPIGYLKWAIQKKFDSDLHHSILKELQRRKNKF